MRDATPSRSPGAASTNATVTHPHVVSAVARRLEAAGVASPSADARWLVERVIEVAGGPGGCGAALLDGLVARRVAREPLQLVLGGCAFRLLELECRSGVFIPRPETEVVAGLAIEAAKAAGSTPVVVEPCTGSGPILCSLVAEVPGVRVTATDVDAAAVDLARSNLARLLGGETGVAGPAPGARGDIVHGALFDGVDPELCGQVDVVVCNPPYLPSSDVGTWEPEVAGHDPLAALVGGPHGDEVVVDVLRAAAVWLRPGGSVVVELDARRAIAAQAEAEALGFVDVDLRRDLTGAVRVITATHA